MGDMPRAGHERRQFPLRNILDVSLIIACSVKTRSAYGSRPGAHHPLFLRATVCPSGVVRNLRQWESQNPWVVLQTGSRDHDARWRSAFRKNVDAVLRAKRQAAESRSNSAVCLPAGLVGDAEVAAMAQGGVVILDRLVRGRSVPTFVWRFSTPAAGWTARGLVISNR